MKYAPILIPTLCRYEKFVECLESLQNNSLAGETDVIIALDYPKKKSHRDGYERIKAYCSSLISDKSHGFKSFTLICRRRNLGAIGNFEHLVNEAFEKYDRCICTFDDMVHSPNFIEYMDKALEASENDKSVCMVTGYSYPVNWTKADGCTAVKQNLEGSIWGIGYLKDNWNEMYSFLRSGELVKQFPIAYREGKFSKMTDWAIKDYICGTVDGAATNSLLRRVTDIAMRIYLTAADKYAVMPVISKTRCSGFDGSGVFCEKIEYTEGNEICSSNYRFDLQPIDEDKHFDLRLDNCFDNTENLPIINRFDKRPEGEIKELLNRTEKYAALNSYRIKLLNLKANVSRVTNKLKRIFSRFLRNKNA